MATPGLMFAIQEVSDIDLAFGGTSVMEMMPAYSDIPREFKSRQSKWCRLCSDWFFHGVDNLRLVPREGVDTSKALRHIKAVLSSFEPKHEHKEAAIAFLLNEWFSDGTWDVAKK